MQASPEFMRVAGHVTFLRHQQRGYARWAETFPCVYSPAAQLIWRFRDDQLEQELTERMSALATLTQQKLTYVSPGPPEHFHSSQELYEHCVELWCRSSIVLNQVCTANEIRYFHFLQPNQYLPGSKPIGPMETRVALKEGSATDLAVKACYPLMQTQSERLLQAGVAFTDLTGVFADHPEPIYNDNCCHMERKGDLIMARAMAAHIKQWVAKSPQSCGHRQRGPHEVRFATQGQAAP